MTVGPSTASPARTIGDAPGAGDAAVDPRRFARRAFALARAACEEAGHPLEDDALRRVVLACAASLEIDGVAGARDALWGDADASNRDDASAGDVLAPFDVEPRDATPDRVDDEVVTVVARALRPLLETRRVDRRAVSALACDLGGLRDALLSVEGASAASTGARPTRTPRRRLGAWSTPLPLARRLVALARTGRLRETRASDSLAILDPTCGGGRVLRLAARACATTNDVPALVLRGFDLDPLAVTLARFELWLDAFAFGSPIDVEVSRRAIVVGDARFDEAYRLNGDAATQRTGFDLIVGNPPWIAHAGRASQPLDAAMRARLAAETAAFGGYPTTHGVITERASAHLAPGGVLAFVLPTSVADLDGYAPVRAAVARRCGLLGRPRTFDARRFEGVFQPGMIVTFRRTDTTRDRSGTGAPWPTRVPGLSIDGARALDALTRCPVLGDARFADIGIQTTRAMRATLHPIDDVPATERLPVREGRDVTAGRLAPPRLAFDLRHADAPRPGERRRARMASADVLVRQTADRPIATVGDGVAFRNSILAAFAHAPWTPRALAAYLSSAPVAWIHRHRHRDAREGMPQVKVGHLRALPDVLALAADPAGALRALERAASSDGKVRDATVDDVVLELLRPIVDLRPMIDAWRSTRREEPAARDPPRPAIRSDG